MEGAVGAELQDWEVLHDASAKGSLTAEEKLNSIGGIEGESDSDSIIKSDYFSLDNQGRRAATVAERDLSEEEGSVESDNPSWIDPGSENRYGRVNSGEFWSDSGSDRSDERKINEIDSKTESGLAELLPSQTGHGEPKAAKSPKLESLESHESKISGSDPQTELVFTGSAEDQLCFEEFGEIQSQSKDLNTFWSDSSGEELVSSKFGDIGKEREIDQSGSKAEKLAEADVHSEEKNLPIEEAKANTESGGGVGEKRKLVWWKVPLEVLKYCMFRASPVWSFSVAAAVMGFIILGRKLYKMKRKTPSLQLKVTLDEKKVSQFTSRAARLNEAFSVVRRVPIVRPALPAAGINPWPAVSMR